MVGAIQQINRWHLASITLFIILIVFLTGRDYVTHGLLYEYGLLYNPEWVRIDWWIYFAQLYAAATACAFIAKSWKLLVVYCAFIYSSAQDLVFYAVWMQMQFPVGDWKWMGNYHLFGTWQTSHQVLFSFAIVATTCLIMFKSPHWRRQKQPYR